MSNPLPNSAPAPYSADANSAPSSTVDNPTIEINRKRKASRPASDVWNDFDKEKLAGKVVCNHCNFPYAVSSSTRTLKNHLKSCKRKPRTEIDTSQKKLGPLFSTYEEGKNAKAKAELGIVEFNQGECRTGLAKMIIIDELSFRFVEGEGFRGFMAKAQPQFRIPSRVTVARDCMSLYFDEKSRLKVSFSDKSRRVCLTTDTWSSLQNLNYMVTTSHYIDENWNYQKKILSFCLIPDHKGMTIGNYLEKCLLEWGIERVTTVTLDNASPNDNAVSYLCEKVINWNADLLMGEFMHMRCCAHILNLIVKEGLQEQNDSIYRVRAAIKYIKGSAAREGRFKLCKEKEKIESKGLVSLDVPTRWNSTYLMLNTAEKFEKAFVRLAIEDEYFRSSMDSDKGRPTADDWKKIRHLCKFLKIFYEATICFSGSSYVTCNVFFHQFCEILDTLKMWSMSPDEILRKMSLNMQKKFDKYWEEDGKLNYIIFVAVVFDPRYKLGYVEFCFEKLYEYAKAEVKIAKVRDLLNRLYTAYSVCHLNSSKQKDPEVQPEGSFGNFSLSSQFKRRVQEKVSIEKKSELERYLVENVEDDYSGFDILNWWMHKSEKYPTLSRIARDILAIPVSSVASESAFSTGGRILDSFRSSLNPNTVEALICAQNWFRSSKIDLVKQLEEIKIIEEEMSGSETLSMNEFS